MKSHLCEFAPKDLLRVAGLPLLPLALFAIAMHLGARVHLLPAPRPALDTERTILVHQAEASRASRDTEVLLLGDSSCLMNLSARQLTDQLGRPALNLGTFSFLDLNAHALLLREHARANPGRLSAVVLLMHPESLRRSGSEAYYLAALTNYLSGLDHCQAETAAGQANCLLGVEIFRGRILSRALPIPLPGAYGRRYGFTHDLENFLARERGSAIDPDPKAFEGTAEYRLAPMLERASKNFRAAVPPGAKLLVGITPAPERFAGPRYPQLHADLLRQWSQWLQADAALTNLPLPCPMTPSSAPRTSRNPSSPATPGSSPPPSVRTCRRSGASVSLATVPQPSRLPKCPLTDKRAACRHFRKRDAYATDGPLNTYEACPTNSCNLQSTLSVLFILEPRALRPFGKD